MVYRIDGRCSVPDKMFGLVAAFPYAGFGSILSVFDVICGRTDPYPTGTHGVVARGINDGVFDISTMHCVIYQ